MARLEIYKHRLANGMNVLTMPQFQIPKVSMQLWYGVGSKDEGSGEKGIAHLIEHMIFKGTTSLSESDINLITHKLSGYCNAFTSHDYTGYVFELPVRNWDCALPIMADCMVNCTFKEDLLNAELKAVIQELKMYKDDYASVLLEKLMSGLFMDHPYRYPVIGYKKDLWSLDRDNLLKFYKKHYVPNNATLVVVGAVEPEDVQRHVEHAFGAIAPDWSYSAPEHYHSSDTVSQQVTVYRDVQQPVVMLAWVVPGLRSRSDYLLEVAASIIGSGKSSRLVHRVVDAEQLATDLDCMVYDFMDHALFIVHFQPKRTEDIPQVIELINEELERLAQEGCTENELQKARKKTELEWMSVVEDQERYAFLIGKHFLATGDEHYILNYLDKPHDTLLDDVKNFTARYLRTAIMHVGTVLPLPEQEKQYSLDLQVLSDQEDARILGRIKRETEIEPGCAVHKVEPRPLQPFEFPKAETVILSNGLKVLHYHNPLLPKINLILDFKVRGYYDPDHQQGLQAFMMDMLTEGTASWPGHAFIHELESSGMTIQATPGQISMSMLSSDLAKGLSLLESLLREALFEPKSLEKVRGQVLADIKDYWDTPTQFIGQLAREAVYALHPYRKSNLGSAESVQAMSRDELIAAYREFITPCGARLALVGNLEQYDVKNILEEKLARWQGPEVCDLEFPILSPVASQSINRYINRDQIVLAFAGLSVRRLDKDYDKILLFDHILTGGSLGSMSSRLFQIRERSGLFYTIGGSLLSGAHDEPGMVFIKTIVSPEKANEAESLISSVLNMRAQDLAEYELEEAQRGITASLIDHFASNHQIGSSFLFLDRFNLPATFFDTRAQALQAITVAEVQDAIGRLMSPDSLLKVRVGRLADSPS